MANHLAARCVGIFWIYKGEIFGAAMPLEGGVRTSLGIIDADIDHASFWETDGAHRTRFPDLIDYEYFDVPRGRVLFDSIGQRSMVYLDATINQPAIREMITGFFGLTAKSTRWHLDPHYVTG